MQKLFSAKLWLPLFYMLILSIPGLLGLIHPGFFASDDGNWMVIRFSAFYEALRVGQIPVRFLPRLLNGYGYPVADFLYPLFMYLGVPIHIVGFNFINTIKILFGLSFVFSGIFSFLWLRRLFAPLSAFVGSLVYLYFPYHVWDMYKRGSIGEMLALSVVPFIFWQIEKRNRALIGLGIGLLILSHNTLALMFLPIVLGYDFLREKNWKSLVFELILGLGLSTFFWLPALFDKQFTVFDSKIVSSVDQYFLTPSLYYLVSFVGLVSIIGAGIALWKKNKLGIFFAIVLVISLFFTIPFSHIIWHVLPLGKYVQFPFRFLSVTILAASFLTAYLVSYFKKPYIVSLIVGICIIISAFPVLFPKTYQFYPDTWYSTNQDSTTVQNEYLPKWVKQIPTNKTTVTQFIKGKGIIKNQMQKGSKILLQTNNTTSTVLQLNTIYFPGWDATIDGKDTDIDYNNLFGLMRMKVPSGQHTIRATFTETPLRLFADVVSFLSCITIFGVFFIYRKK